MPQSPKCQLILIQANQDLDLWKTCLRLNIIHINVIISIIIQKKLICVALVDKIEFMLASIITTMKYFIAYINEEGEHYILPLVNRVKVNLATDDCLKNGYLPPTGLQSFNSVASKLLLGQTSPAVLENKVRINKIYNYILLL